MGSFSIWHRFIVLVVVVLILAPKLRNIGQDLAAHGLVDGMKSRRKPEPAVSLTAAGRIDVNTDHSKK